MGRHVGLWLAPLTHTFYLHLQRRGPFTGCWSWVEAQAGDRPALYWWQGQYGFSSTMGSEWLPLFQGQGQAGKHVSGQVLLQDCHSTALPSNARLGRKLTRKPDQARIVVDLGSCLITSPSTVVWGHHLFLPQVPESGHHAGTHCPHLSWDLAPSHCMSSCSLSVSRKTEELPRAPCSAKGSHCCWGFFGFAFNSLD